jgi:hypothetical protein
VTGAERDVKLQYVKTWFDFYLYPSYLLHMEFEHLSPGHAALACPD